MPGKGTAGDVCGLAKFLCSKKANWFVNLSISYGEEKGSFVFFVASNKIPE